MYVLRLCFHINLFDMMIFFQNWWAPCMSGGAMYFILILVILNIFSVMIWICNLSDWPFFCDYSIIFTFQSCPDRYSQWVTASSFSDFLMRSLKINEHCTLNDNAMCFILILVILIIRADTLAFLLCYTSLSYQSPTKLTLCVCYIPQVLWPTPKAWMRNLRQCYHYVQKNIYPV